MKDMLKDNYGKQCNGLMDRTCDNMMSMESNSPDSMSYDRINNSRGLNEFPLKLLIENLVTHPLLTQTF